MSEEKLLDAMAYIPEKMLIQTDKLRQKKPVYWQQIAAVAASLCLLIGLGFAWQWIAPGAKSTADGAGGNSFLADEEDCAENITQSSMTAPLLARIETVSEDMLTVTAENITYTVSFEKLGTVPNLVPGQWVRIYAEKIQPDSILTPYKIVIEEDTP